MLVPHLKPDPPAWCNVSIHHHLMAPLPFEEEPPCDSIWQTGLVVPHQVPAHKATVVPRMQSAIQQEGVIF